VFSEREASIRHTLRTYFLGKIKTSEFALKNYDIKLRQRIPQSVASIPQLNTTLLFRNKMAMVRKFEVMLGQTLNHCM
jgi:hypothetical protein